MELKICILPQFRAIDPPNPARGFIQQNENVRFATAACMQKYGNVSFATVACAKCMRYGGRGGGPIPWGGGGGGGGWQHGTRHHIYTIQLYNHLQKQNAKKKKTHLREVPPKKKFPSFATPVFVPFNDPLFRTGSVKKGNRPRSSGFSLQTQRSAATWRRPCFEPRTPPALRSRFGISQIEEKMVGSACGRVFGVFYLFFLFGSARK